MSNFVQRLLPLLPASMQFEELAEAASHLNRFAELLSTAERQLVRSEWHRATQSLLSSNNVATVQDNMAITLYLRLIDHWALPHDKRFDPAPFVGMLLLASETDARSIGFQAADTPDFLTIDSSNKEESETALLLANTLSKLLDALEPETLCQTLSLVAKQMTGCTWPLFSAGITRALRSRHTAVRKRAWMSASKLLHFDSHHVLQLVREGWKVMVEQERQVEVLTAMCQFFTEAHAFEGDVGMIKEWMRKVQEALIAKKFDFLQCRIIRLARIYGHEEILCSALQWEPSPLVQLELLRFAKLDADALQLSLKLIHDLVQDPKRLPEALVLLEAHARLDPKILLHCQKEILEALESYDGQLRLQALSALVHAANTENWELLMANAKAIIVLASPIECEVSIGALRIASELITKFVPPSDGLTAFLDLLDVLPESLCEEHAERLASMVYPSWNLDGISREALFGDGKQHSLAHDLVVLRMIGDTFDATFASGLVAEYLEREPDGLILFTVLDALERLQARGGHLYEKTGAILTDHLKNLKDADMTLRIRRLLGDGDQTEDSIQALVKLFDLEFSSEINPKRAERENRVVEKTPLALVIVSEPFSDETPMPLEAVKITSDLFKGLL